MYLFPPTRARHHSFQNPCFYLFIFSTTAVCSSGTNSLPSWSSVYIYQPKPRRTLSIRKPLEHRRSAGSGSICHKQKHKKQKRWAITHRRNKTHAKLTSWTGIFVVWFRCSVARNYYWYRCMRIFVDNPNQYRWIQYIAWEWDDRYRPLHFFYGSYCDDSFWNVLTGF